MTTATTTVQIDPAPSRLVYAIPATNEHGPVRAAVSGERMYTLTDYADRLVGIMDLMTARRTFGDNLIILS